MYIEGTTNPSLEEISRNFAVNLHNARGLKYGDEPYSVHLEKVARLAKAHILLLPKDLFTEKEQEIIICAAWCHDTLEDCGIHYSDLKDVVGTDVADVVYSLTDELAKTKMERAKLTYPKIAQDKLARFIKACDRYANMSSVKTKDKVAMYIPGYPYFRESLYDSNYYTIWDALDKLFYDYHKGKPVS